MDIHQISGYTPTQLLQPVIAIAAQASTDILGIYNSDFAIRHKDDNTPLTAADIASHNIICKGLASLTPDIPILSEESATIAWATRKTWDTYWLVDPLDGTREFINRNGEFTVNIALIHAHHSVLGVVHVPVGDSCYFASSNGGAYKSVNGSRPSRIHTRPTSSKKFIVAGSRSHESDQQRQFFKSLGPATEIVNIGSSLKFCLIAEGELDIYPRFGPTSEWDTAAAQCIVEQAGGVVTDMQLNRLKYNTKQSLLNPDFVVIADKGFDWKSRLGRIA